MIYATPCTTLLVNLDNNSAYVPILSTITSLVHLYYKYIGIQNHISKALFEPLVVERNYYFTHITYSDTRRQIALLFPFVGNFSVFIYDCYCKQQGNHYYKLASKTGDATEKIDALERAGEFGHVESMQFAGYLQLNNSDSRDKWGFWTNNERALTLLHKAAHFGNTRAMAVLGQCYQKGYIIKKDEKKAFLFFECAAKAGNSQGIVELASCYFYGKGTPENHELGEMLHAKIKKLKEPLGDS